MHFDDKSDIDDRFFLLKHKEYILLQWYPLFHSKKEWMIRQGQMSPAKFTRYNW